MTVTEYKGKKNDLLINLINRWTIKGNDTVITITLLKDGKGFKIIQWGMTSNGNDLPELDKEIKFKGKKYLVYSKVTELIRIHYPNYLK